MDARKAEGSYQGGAQQAIYSQDGVTPPEQNTRKRIRKQSSEVTKLPPAGTKARYEWADKVLQEYKVTNFEKVKCFAKWMTGSAGLVAGTGIGIGLGFAAVQTLALVVFGPVAPLAGLALAGLNIAVCTAGGAVYGLPASGYLSYKMISQLQFDKYHEGAQECRDKLAELRKAGITEGDQVDLLKEKAHRLHCALMAT
ncbi:hypothetical protein [Parendozoicomonas haliclonae]|uniref:Uncharacterized protein n=1 Tax=Parendozoicomonas haliclonae TaxID=1960125 RepID=A0A1X7ANC6_9GAMM|nr:hypothetical protein [Parendozoicomonas haliclonae]SMA49576.1 hypothetical protein EHSB41UT_03362 [Parendozoicomonas haliclonae]